MLNKIILKYTILEKHVETLERLQQNPMQSNPEKQLGYEYACSHTYTLTLYINIVYVCGGVLIHIIIHVIIYKIKKSVVDGNFVM